MILYPTFDRLDEFPLAMGTLSTVFDIKAKSVSHCSAVLGCVPETDIFSKDSRSVLILRSTLPPSECPFAVDTMIEIPMESWTWASTSFRDSELCPKLERSTMIDRRRKDVDVCCYNWKECRHYARDCWLPKQTRKEQRSREVEDEFERTYWK